MGDLLHWSLMIFAGGHGLRQMLLWLPVPALLAVTLLWRRATAYRRLAQWETARRREVEAYCALQVSFRAGAGDRKQAEQAKRVCRLVIDHSVFGKAALLLRETDGVLMCAGSAGLDDLQLAALAVWGARLQQEEIAGGSEPRQGNAVPSFTVVLDGRGEFDLPPDHGCADITLIPVRMHRGRLVGVLAVCLGPATEEMTESAKWMPEGERLRRAVVPLELLAAVLARTFERSLLIERLMQVERLAGAGRLVAGVAQELTTPLASVFGTAELLAETAAEPRVRQEAATIVTHALKMQETLHRLRDFWQPRLTADAIERARNGV